MIQQTIMWTAIPRGVADDGSLLLTVFVSPQLKTDASPGKLGQFKDFLDWPATLAKLKFDVDFGGSTRAAERTSDETDSTLWTALFNEKTYVRPYEFRKFDDKLIFSYPARNVHDFLKEKYQKYAVSDPDDFPSKESLAGDFVQVSFFRPSDLRPTNVGVPQGENDRQIVDRLRRQMLKENALRPGPSDPPTDFFLLKWFHTPKNKRTPDTPTTHNNKSAVKTGVYQKSLLKPPEIDFHQAVSSLGSYPKLLRTMGLAFDLKIPSTPAVPSSSTVRVIPKWPGGLPSLPKDDKTPKTRYIVSGKKFAARPRASEPEVTEDGVLRLRDGGDGVKQLYSLIQVDLDGMAMKTMNFAYNIFAAETRRTLGTPDTSSLPSARSAGISIVRTGRALRLARHLKGATQKNTDMSGGTEPELSAEDLVRGYRVDVYDAVRGKWFSLCKRAGRYEFTAIDRTENLEDEGFLQTSVTGSADDTTDDLYLPESLGVWDGWSLCAPRPGASINNDGKVERTPTEFSEEFKLRASFRAAPGSLPSLRYGGKYRIRIRIADLAGGGPTVDDLNPTDFSNATDEEFYTRFEPVGPPFMVLKNKIDGMPGESLERLVIRSFNKSVDLDTVPIDTSSERHLAPPAMAALDAETHGVFDLPAVQVTDENLKKQYDLIVSKEGRFASTGPADLKNPPNPIDASDIIVDLPYLPDPFAYGVVIFDLPGVPAGKVLQIRDDGSQSTSALTPPSGTTSLTKIEFRRGSEWYNRDAFRIRLKEGAAGTPPSWDNGGRVLTVFAPKSEIYRCRYASYFHESGELERMGIWNWVVEKGPGNLGALKSMALDGRHWMLTPYRTLELAHVVQQPLGFPAFTGLQADKQLGATFARLLDKLLVSGKSTSKIDVYGEWQEPVDPLDEPEPKTIDGKARACEIRVDDHTSDTLYLDSPHEFGDTKHRIVRYRAVATTRFREFLPPELVTDDPSDPGKVEKNITRSSEVVEKNILSSARPDAPKILYVVPTFGWESGSGPNDAKTSKRIGGGLRIWMDRPWFSSGEGELLGVMIWTGSFDSIPDRYKPYVTQWGVDPIWQSGSTSSGPAFNDFKGWHHNQIDITLDEVAIVPTIKPITQLQTLTQFSEKEKQSNAAKPKAEVLKKIEGVDDKVVAQIGKKSITTEPIKEAEVVASKQYLASTVATQDQVALDKKIKEADAASKLHKSTIDAALGNLTVVKPTLAVVGHRVEYDKARRLWYCDIQIDAGNSYYPFVRLALVRYQPDSVANAFVSRVVLADFAQLAPDRAVGALSDPENPRRTSVAVTGLTYKSSEAEQHGSRIEVSIETRRPDVDDPELAWVPVPDANIELISRKVNDINTLWAGTVTLPEPRGSRPYRVVVKEYEHFIRSGSEAGGSATLSAFHPAPVVERRIVFADAIEL